jgi:hypothetical protein
MTIIFKFKKFFDGEKVVFSYDYYNKKYYLESSIVSREIIKIIPGLKISNNELEKSKGIPL